MLCGRCYNEQWTCENHPDRPSQGPFACDCGGAGCPCPDCNPMAEGSEEGAEMTTPERYQNLLANYRELTESVAMIREAVEMNFPGTLPSKEHTGIRPSEECEAIARAIYAAGDQMRELRASSTPAQSRPE